MKSGPRGSLRPGRPASLVCNLALCTWATCAPLAGAQAKLLRGDGSALLAVSHYEGHPPVEGQRVGAHGAHGHPHGNHSHGGKHRKHHHHHSSDTGAAGSLHRWGSSHNDTGSEPTQTSPKHKGKHNGHKHHHQRVNASNASNAPSGQNTTAAKGANATSPGAKQNASSSNSSSSLSSEVKSLVHGMCMNSNDLCHGAENADWNCVEQCQRQMEGCAERKGKVDYSKCRAEVEEVYGITWGRWMDPSRHRRNTTMNATALAIAAVESDEADPGAPQGHRSRPSPPLRAAADDDD